MAEQQVDTRADGVVARAEELATEGHALEALDLLARAEPVDEVLRALPSLRRRAFFELDGTGGLPSWPAAPQVAAPPVGPRGLPELDVADLTADVLRASIQAHGCLLVRGVADDAECAALSDGVDEAFAGVDRRRAADRTHAAEGRRPRPFDDGSAWYAPLRLPGNKTWSFGRKYVEDGAGVLTADSPRMLAELFGLYERKGVRDVVAGYLGERPVLSAKKCTLRRVPPDSDSHWHQDGSFLGGGLRVLNIWLTLTRCGVDAPGLDLVPRRLDQVLPPGTGDARFDNLVGHDALEPVLAESPAIRPEFQPGEALLFDELFLHSTAADPAMPRSRYAIESWFFAPSAYPDPDDQVPLVW